MEVAEAVDVPGVEQRAKRSAQPDQPGNDQVAEGAVIVVFPAEPCTEHIKAKTVSACMYLIY